MANVTVNCSQCGRECAQGDDPDQVCQQCRSNSAALAATPPSAVQLRSAAPQGTKGRGLVVVGVIILFAILAVAVALLLQQIEQVRGTDALLRRSETIIDLMRREMDVRYEYNVVAFSSEGNSRLGKEAAAFSTVTPSNEDLDKAGLAGWEVVTSYLEVETAFPNFGDDKFVTGIQPNVRPQRLVVILRRRLPPPLAPLPAAPTPSSAG